MRLKLTFKTLIWHQHDKEEKLISKEWKLKAFQN
jgi:hypothetical protein